MKLYSTIHIVEIYKNVLSHIICVIIDHDVFLRWFYMRFSNSMEIYPKTIWVLTETETIYLYGPTILKITEGKKIDYLFSHLPSVIPKNSWFFACYLRLLFQYLTGILDDRGLYPWDQKFNRTVWIPATQEPPVFGTAEYLCCVVSFSWLSIPWIISQFSGRFTTDRKKISEVTFRKISTI